MPAVTASDLTVLPRVVAAPGAQRRPVLSLTSAPSGLEGEGFPVKRAFAGVDLSLLDPFVHLDEMGEVDYAPGEPKGTPWHPHRGFETVTYLMDGTFVHQDSHGGGGTITDGATQWMTAGSGLLHIEAPPEELVMSGGLFHGLQLWVNLPRADKWAAPRYQDLEPGETALLASADGASLVRVIAGEITTTEPTGETSTHRGPGHTHSPMVLVHASLEPGSRLDLPWRRDFNALVYVMSGSGTVDPDGARPTGVRASQLAVLGAGDVVSLGAGGAAGSGTETLEVIILGGLPIREPVAWAGPFVMNTRDELAQAFEDYRSGRLGVIPAN